MKSVVFYAIDPSKDHTSCGPCGKCDNYTKIATETGQVFFVRAEIVNLDGLRAITRSKPRKGEMLLNSMEV